MFFQKNRTFDKIFLLLFLHVSEIFHPRKKLLCTSSNLILAYNQSNKEILISQGKEKNGKNWPLSIIILICKIQEVCEKVCIKQRIQINKHQYFYYINLLEPYDHANIFPFLIMHESTIIHFWCTCIR